MPRQSLLDFLHDYPRHGRSAAYIERNGYRIRRISYQETAELAARCACEFERRGIVPGDRVVLWGRNSGEWVAAFFACILRGAVAVPMDAGAAPDFATSVAQQVGAKLLIVDRDLAASAGERPWIPFDTLKELGGGASAGAVAPHESPPLRRDSLAQILFTSGATSTPKGVLISHGNILANLEPLEAAMQPYLKWERLVHPLRFLDAVPLSHVFGQFMSIWVPPLLGAGVCFEDSLNPSEILAAIRRERVSVLVAVPRVLEAMQGKLERDLEACGALEAFREDFAKAEGESIPRRLWHFRAIHRRFGWKFWAVVSGGASLEPEAERFWNRVGIAAIQGYGLTETTSLVSVNHPFRVGRGSIGKVLAGREVRLDEEGEILVRGESVASGYWQEGQPIVGNGTKAGWFHTGDLGALDAAGNLYFKGRKKNVIVSSAGMNVYPEDLETLLRREPEVKDCVVVGLDRGGNAEPCGVLLLHDETRLKQPRHAAGILARVNNSLAEYQRMRTWFLWPEADFPRTSTGKPRLGEIRAAVEAQWSNGNGAGAWPATTGGIGELVSRIRGGPNEIEDGARLENDLHLSSLDRVELLSAIEDRYQVDLNETRFAEARTVGELQSLVRASSVTRTECAFPRWPQRWPVTWIRSLVYYLLTWPATHLLAHPRVSGRENLRGVKGPALIICNHVIYLDAGFVLAALPARYRARLAIAMGGERLAELRRPPAHWSSPRRWLSRMKYFLVTTLFNVFPLPKRSGVRESFRFAGDLADRGWSILVFPEGELTPDGAVQPFRAGTGLLASNLGLPVIPLRIDGAYEIREARRIFSRPGRVRVQIGKPVRFAAGTSADEIVHVLEQHVREMGHEAAKPESVRVHAAGQ